MSYINQITGYRKDILTSRSIVKRGDFALIEPDGLVKNVISGFDKCTVTILASPKIGLPLLTTWFQWNRGAAVQRDLEVQGSKCSSIF